MFDDNLYERTVDIIKDRRERVLSGKINCIPWGIPRLEKVNPGIEQAKYYLLTANSKVGKTQISDWIFLYNTITQVVDEGLDVNLRIFYFTLEMSKEEKMMSAFSHFLYIKKGIRLSPTDLKSTSSDRVLSEEHLEALQELEPYFKKIEEVVTFIDSIRHPTGIFKFMEDYALNNGVQHKKEVVFTDNKTGIETRRLVDDYYEPNDPDEYVICLIDHISLITPEKEDGRELGLHASITKLSATYLIALRNKYGHIPVVIQQQKTSQESNDNARLDKLRPTLDGLGDNTLTQRDANVIIGLFSPFRHKIKEHMGYDVEAFQDNIRFLEIIGGRDGGGGSVSPLYFDGAVNFFKELPLPDDRENLSKVYELLRKIRN